MYISHGFSIDNIYSVYILSMVLVCKRVHVCGSTCIYLYYTRIYSIHREGLSVHIMFLCVVVVT